MRRLLFLIVLVILTATTGVARADVIWVTRGDGTTLVNFNNANSSLSTTGAAGVSGAYAAAFDTNGDLYSMLALEISSSGVMYAGCLGHVEHFNSINKTTSATLFGSTRIDSVMDFAFDSAGNLWRSELNQLYKINTAKGAVSGLVDITGTLGSFMGNHWHGPIRLFD